MYQEWHLYCISDGEYTKIGISVDVQNRLSTLQIGNAKKLFLAHSFPVGSRSEAQYLEQQLHKDLAECRAVGEWFKITWGYLEPFINAARYKKKMGELALKNALLQRRFDDLVTEDIATNYPPMKHNRFFRIRDESTVINSPNC